MTQGRFARIILITIIAMAGIPTPIPAETIPVIGGFGNVPPLAFEENGVIKGFFFDVYREAAKRVGFDAILELYPTKRLLSNLKTGDIDGVAALSYRNERAAYLVYSTTPVMVSRILVFVKKGKEFPFSSIKDLFGKRIGVIAGWNLNNSELDRAAKEGKVLIDEVTNFDQNLKKLLAARVDCLITTEQLTWYHANALGIAQNIVALDKQVADLRVYFAVSKFTKNITSPEALIERMDAALKEMLSDGTHTRLQKKHQITSLE